MNDAETTIAAPNWLAKRTSLFDSSGIREVFNLAKELDNPINLSIGQVDYPLPEPVKKTLIESIERGNTDYALSQGIAPLRDRMRQEVVDQYNDPDRDLFISSGTSGGLVLAMFSLIDPGDEVIIFDPWFVMYHSLPQLCGGVPVPVSIYPDFRLNMDKVRDAVTPRTKMIIVNCPANPTGVSFNRQELKELSEFAAEQKHLLVVDEIYSKFMYDEPHVSPVEFNPQTVVVDGVFQESRHDRPATRICPRTQADHQRDD